MDVIALSISMLLDVNCEFSFSLFLNYLSFKLFLIVSSASKANDFTFLAMKQHMLTLAFELDWDRNF